MTSVIWADDLTSPHPKIRLGANAGGTLVQEADSEGFFPSPCRANTCRFLGGQQNGEGALLRFEGRAQMEDQI